MSIKRRIIDTGKKVANFFPYGAQNQYYKHLFLSEAKSHIGNKPYAIDVRFERESKKYWKQHTGHRIVPLWHNFYSSCNGIKDVCYVPENLYYAYIEPYYNRKEFCSAIDDKCYYDLRFPVDTLQVEAQQPHIILRNINGIFYDKEFLIMKTDDAADKIASLDTGYVIKESITGRGGNRIVFVEPGETKNRDEILSIFNGYGKDFVIESIVEQCDELKALNPSSVNTIRYITYLDEGGIHLLSSVMRIGGKGARKDNFSTGGMAAGITSDGTLKNCGYDQQFNKYEKTHPNGLPFAGVKIPSYEKGIELVKSLHCRYGHFRIISWDVAIGRDYTPIIIEFNLTPQGIDLHQINNGPLFGFLTDKVLYEVFHTAK